MHGRPPGRPIAHQVLATHVDSTSTVGMNVKNNKTTHKSVDKKARKAYCFITCMYKWYTMQCQSIQYLYC